MVSDFMPQVSAMFTDTTISRALELYSMRIEVPLTLLTLRPRSPDEGLLSVGRWAAKLCEREDALQAFLSGRHHFSGSDQALIEWVLYFALKEAYAGFGEDVVRLDAPR